MSESEQAGDLAGRFYLEPAAAFVRHTLADTQRLAVTVSQTARCDRLALLAEANVRGRACQGRQLLFDNIAVFVEFCREEDCLCGPRAFAEGTEAHRVDWVVE